MVLPVEKSKRITTLSEQKFMVYGRPKIGKTVFANEFPNPLFLATEPGHSHIECHKINITSWSKFLEACKALTEETHSFSTVIVDIVDNLYDMCSDYICMKKGFEHPSDLPMGKGYGFINEEFRRVINKLARLGYTVVFISHLNTEKVKTKTKEYDKFTLTVTGRTRKFILGLCDHILFLTSRMEKDSEERIVRTRGSMYWEGGSRNRELEEEEVIPYGFEELAKYFTNSKIEKEV